MTASQEPGQRRRRRRSSAPLDKPALSTLLRHLATGTASSRADLARATGLARSTVAERVDTLVDAGLVREEPGDRTKKGRPPLSLRLNPEAGVILAVDLDLTRTRVAIADLDGRTIDSTTVDVAIGKGPNTVLTAARDQLLVLLEHTGRTVRDVRGIGVSAIGPVEHATGTVVRPPIMPGWDNCNIPSYFRTLATLTVVDNDANLMAVAEHHRLSTSQPAEIQTRADHLLFVRVDAGIGCGIISQGHLHRGAEGAAGDIGHIRLPDNNTPCTCGSTGCLEAVASGTAIARNIFPDHPGAHSVQDVTRLALAGNPAARSAVRTASRHIGDVLAGLISFYNPNVVIIGGEMAKLEEDILTGITSRIYELALPLALRSLKIKTSELGDNAAIEGAILLAQQEILSPENLPTLLATTGRVAL